MRGLGLELEGAGGFGSLAVALDADSVEAPGVGDREDRAEAAEGDDDAGGSGRQAAHGGDGRLGGARADAVAPRHGAEVGQDVGRGVIGVVTRAAREREDV
ncbi:hypothetical protein [Nannocystis pusilla]|uniref:hypothetical protein n=1 Tax=Nannocystis pusilla TaxID=889268 RepID=UPI003B7FD0BA